MRRIINQGAIVIILLLLYSNSQAQQIIEGELLWTGELVYGLEGKDNYKTLSFTEAQFDFEQNNMPFFYFETGIYNGKKLNRAIILDATYEPLSNEEAKLIEGDIPSEIELSISHSEVRKRIHSYIKFYPFRKNTYGQLEKLIKYKIQLDYSRKQRNNNKSMTFAAESVLREGDWYKIGVTKDAVFQLDYNFLSSLGIELNQIDPREIRIYGYGGGMLPQENSEERPDDLVENAIQVVGENDGSFDKSDYILFYGEDQVIWAYDSADQMFTHQVNLFSDTTYYFITTNNGFGKRIVKEAQSSEIPSQIVDEYDYYDFHELDQRNLLSSGRLWVGEIFDGQLTYDFIYDVPNVVTSKKGKIELNVLARSNRVSQFSLEVNNQEFPMNVSGTNLNRSEIDFAKQNISAFEFDPSAGNQVFTLNYDKPQSTSRGWLNRMSFNLRRRLVHQSDQTIFRDSESAGTNQTAEFQLQANNPIQVWDLTDKYNVIEKFVASSVNSYNFISKTDVLRKYVSFDSYNTSNVFAIGRVQNQNLHASAAMDLVIVTHPKFKDQALKLANFHESEGLRTLVTTPQKIYNEFSSGSQDIIAIRSFFKMFYDRAVNESDMIKYGLFIGDASYDYKYRISGNTNFVPAYQSPNSLDPVFSYVSDDYFALLDNSEGRWQTNASVVDKMDIAIGRFPVKTELEAEGIVQKIIKYSSNQGLSDWRNKVVFVADDGDGVTHMFQANDLARRIELNDKEFNTEKIFLDAFQQQSTAGGARYPEANQEINQSVQQGALFVNYTGHGGETGWTGERVLGISDITSWENINNLPIFITATCEFSRYDDPLRTSGGELTILNPNGGGVALMTTTRLVFSSPNYLLNRTFYNKVFERNSDGSSKRLGDIFMEVKNLHSSQTNSRNFSLLGDPALQMAIPKFRIITTAINGKPISQIDTINALSKVTVEGYIANYDSTKLDGFNGILTPTIFDKEEEKRTLNNDGGGVFRYNVRENRIFKGKVSVINGNFNFSFVVPKDISYQFGNGKISYYADNSSDDAHGFTENLIIGGSNPNAIEDDLGPEMQLFMNDESFIFGGITDNNPTLIVNLSDAQGINTIGSGIGHDLVAVLDEQTDKSFILNDFYEAALDDYTQGKVRFPFNDLAPGRHTLRVKAWDVANNSSEKTIEFNVVESGDLVIQNIVNYPNPFTTNTEFIFQHNQPGVPLDVKVEIFTVSGKLVKSIDRVSVDQGFTSRGIRWDGKDDYGDKIGKGVYVYKLKVRSRNGSSVEKFEKLVIL